jgi:hypothetical protein
MNKQSKEMARIAKLHYDYANQFSEDPKKFEDIMMKELPNWDIKHELSNRGIMVADKDNKRVISIKGTNPKHAEDIISDLALATGLHKSNKQFIERKNQIKDIMRRDKDKEYYLTGHSLGASIGSYALASSPSIARNVKNAYLFNPGSTPIFEAMLKPRQENVSLLEEKIKTYKHYNDPISYTAGKFGEVFTTKTNKKGLNPHTISNFI